MGNKTITYILLGVILLIFIAYFTTRSSVYSSDETITVELNNIIKYVQAENWAKAEESTNKLIKSWDRVKHLLALNYAEEDYSFFLENLARIKGGIIIKDNKEIVNQALSCLELWENFTRVVPQP